MKVTTRALAIAATIVGTVTAPTAAFAADSAAPGPDGTPTLENGGSDWLAPVDRGTAMATNAGRWASTAVPANPGSWLDRAPWDTRNSGHWSHPSRQSSSDWAHRTAKERPQGRHAKPPSAGSTDCLGIAAIDRAGCDYVPRHGVTVGEVRQSRGNHTQLKPFHPRPHHGHGHAHGRHHQHGGAGDGYAPPPGQPEKPPMQLPETGQPIAPLAGAGAAMLAAGATLLVAGRRKPSPRPRTTATST